MSLNILATIDGTFDHLDRPFWLLLPITTAFEAFTVAVTVLASIRPALSVAASVEPALDVAVGMEPALTVTATGPGD